MRRLTLILLAWMMRPRMTLVLLRLLILSLIRMPEMPRMMVLTLRGGMLMVTVEASPPAPVAAQPLKLTRMRGRASREDQPPRGGALHRRAVVVILRRTVNLLRWEDHLRPRHLHKLGLRLGSEL